MTRLRVDPRLRARLREIAREIVLRDRVARKFGSSQNTIGEIERALVRAFELGRDAGGTLPSVPRPGHVGVDWEEVPPRGRDVLMMLTFRSEGLDVVNPAGLCPAGGGGRPRFAYRYCDGRMSGHTVAAGGVNPLLASGLLQASKTDSDLLVLTPRGRATCEAYWRRREVRDPTLPKESIRA